MLYFSRWKTLAILGVCLLGLLLPIPNFFSKERYDRLPGWLQHHIGLGLDLRGGAHVLASMNLDELRKDWYAKLTDEARKRMRDAKIGYTGLGAAPGGGVLVRLLKPDDADAAMKALRPMSSNLPNISLAAAGGVDIDVRREGTDAIVIQPTEAGINARVGQAIGAAVEIVRNRLDPGGIKEVSVQRQGNDRILVQVPGVEDTKDIIEAFNVAKLTFHLLHPSLNPETMGARPPPGYEVVPDRDKPDVTYLINTSPLVTGEDLVDSQPSFDRNGEPMVTFRFNQRGAVLFGRVTKENVGRPFAMIIDGKVLSAPRINEPILGGSGQITGNFAIEDANRLATNLRSGALPAKLTVVEERVVGASLGADSIEAGKRAALIGMLGVAAFMILAYGLFGVFAVIGAAMHVVLVIAIMTLLGSTMTLPGIAGVVLTIGMAVDANVLIYERIREELRNKKTPVAAIDAGFARAYGTIIDSQLTTFIAGLLMFVLGSGPIRGFAVTLTLGILTTVFTAFTITRLLVSWWRLSYKGKPIPAPL